MNQSVKILGLVPYPLGQAPSQRYRIEQWQPLLEQQGIFLNLKPFADSRLAAMLHKPGNLTAKAISLSVACVRRSLEVGSASRYDAVLIHRAACLAGPAILERALALGRKPVVFDFDDAIYTSHTTSANKLFGWLKFPGKTADICRRSAHVVVGNSLLAEYARQHNKRVTIVPSSVDTERYKPGETRSSNGRTVVGWMGSSTSQTHLEAFAPALREFFTRTEAELRVISDREPRLPGIDYVWREWSAQSEVDELAQFDIGIMPMPDDEWSRGKCAMKALLYMAMGVPVVCSAVGANVEVIRQNENGLLGATARELLAGLDKLIADPAERKRLGAGGRQTVEEGYSMTRSAAKFARVIEQTVNRRLTASDYQFPETSAKSLRN